MTPTDASAAEPTTPSLDEPAVSATVKVPERLTSSLVKAILLWTFLTIPPWVITQNYVPRDDALRHVAKALSGRPWEEVLVIRPDVQLDQHPGWHAFLGTAQHLGLRKPGHLIALSVCALAFAVLVAPLAGFRRPEAWAAALLAALLADPALLTRLFLGRPYLVSIAALLFVSSVWTRLADAVRPTRLLVAVSCALALANWMHGNSVLWGLPLAAFLCARQWTAAARFAACAAVGVLGGALLTQHPVAFVHQTLLHTIRALGSGVPSWLLVGEFQPTGGPLAFVGLTGVILYAINGRLDLRRLERNPLFWLSLGGWILGLKTLRFWLDWGLPALVVLLAQNIQSWLEARPAPAHFRRLLWTSILCATLTLATIADHGRRWSNETWRTYAPVFAPQNRQWLPDPGGILYNDSMNVFYLGLYLNPWLNYRFLLGYEPALLPDAELKTLRNIQWQGASDPSLAPWIMRLRDIDRILITRRGPPPNYPALEWYAPMPGVWIGRRPQVAKLSTVLRGHLENDSLEPVTSVQTLPLGARQSMQAIFGGQLDIANPGDPSEAAPHTTNAPRRRMLAAGCSSTRCVMAYERRERPGSSLLVVFQGTPTAMRLEWSAIAPRRLVTLEDVRRAVLDGTAAGFSGPL